MDKIDPWSSEAAFDYTKLFEEFGMSEMTPELVHQLFQPLEHF